MGESVEIGPGYKYTITVQVTDKMVRQFAEMCGDNNPIHLDDEFAKTTRFGRRIAHGMIMGSLFSRVLNDCMGPGGIYLSQTLKFLSPVFIDDVLTIDATVSSLRKERGIASVETVATSQRGDVCVKGEAMVMFSKNIKSKE